MKADFADSINVPLQYLANDQDLAVYIASVGGGEVIPHEGNYVMQTVLIENGRKQVERFKLDREGFELVKQTSVVTDFFDEDSIASIYEEEVKAVVQRVTGAASIEVFDHTHRAASESIRKAKRIREPSETIHNDYTAQSGPNRLREHFAGDPDRAEALMKNRFAIVNLWRSVNGPVYNHPLAMCNARSVAVEDLVSVKRQAKDRVGEIQFCLYNPNHQWYYFPQMQMDEALVFKTYDSATDGRSRFTIHTSFVDPDAAPDAPVRESIESRCFAFF
jgi:hypothetical protein